MPYDDGSFFRSKLVSYLWRSFSTQKCSKQSSADKELFAGKGSGKNMRCPCVHLGLEAALSSPSLPSSSVRWLRKEGPAVLGPELRSGAGS